jgi:hypothetical protein
LKIYRVGDAMSRKTEEMAGQVFSELLYLLMTNISAGTLALERLSGAEGERKENMQQSLLATRTMIPRLLAGLAILSNPEAPLRDQFIRYPDQRSIIIEQILEAGMACGPDLQEIAMAADARVC